MLKCTLYFNLEARTVHFHFTGTRYCTISRCCAWHCFMNPIISIDSDAVVITRPLTLKDNSICEIRLYSLVTAVTGLGAVRSRHRDSIPEKGQKVFFSLQCIDRLWNLHSLLFNGYRRPIARIKLLGREALNSPLSSAKDYNKSSQASSPLYSITVTKPPIHYTQLQWPSLQSTILNYSNQDSSPLCSITYLHAVAHN
jgi:hypothetical protein